MKNGIGIGMDQFDLIALMQMMEELSGWEAEPMIQKIRKGEDMIRVRYREWILN
jgi:hypothetical protein